MIGVQLALKEPFKQMISTFTDPYIFDSLNKLTSD